MFNSALPYLARNTVRETATLVSFLAELSCAVRDAEVPISIAEPFFSQLIKSTVSNLSLRLLQPDQSAPKEPHWWQDSWRQKEHPTSIYKDKLGGRISRLYCLCRTRGLDTEAKSILAWLDREAESAHVAVFPFVLIPFMKALRPIHQETGVAVSAEMQETCVSITTKLSQRCIGPEPQMPADWCRPPITCPGKEKDCKICGKVNEFLGQPGQKEKQFNNKEWAHLPYYSVPYYSRKGDDLVKNNFEWDSQHREWADRLRQVQIAMPAFETVKDLYGDRWEEVKRMIWSRKADFK